ncbi:MAG: hypothetical protein COV72_02535 [Candidatus Omnitrophica bacterium CG11_big_fil_rev_8_21_14_0_20_42_13]|uniref:6-bladed beta-propeller n=1 Tax=Candidatus Ghiorseimicrobium undicola TaxID=1974746 RepID=A0A2H0LYL4_9BACT|nr:MAG: hypothetical protein COV72_02535 [Candidatus Omnitrophica bacterium CG11_big_fil_rev_8_21_14_0_20_42_13]
MEKRNIFFERLVKFFTVILFTICSLFFVGFLPSFCESAPSGKITHKYLFEIKPDANKIGALNQPADIAVDVSGNLYAADTVNSRIVVFDASGNAKFAFGRHGTGKEELSAPMALTVDSKNKKVYVADSSNYRIQIFKTDGIFLSSIDLNKDKTGEEKDVRPIGIAVAGGGNIYVSDADNNYIRIYSSDGKFLSKFGGFGSENGKFCIPVGLFVDADDKLYVVDMNNSRLQVFDNQGNFLFKIGSAGDARGDFGRPKDVCVDENGFIYVSDGANLVIQIFDKNGEFIDLIGAEKEVDLQFASPFGLAVLNGRLYITDRWRNSIRVYEIEEVSK